MKEIIKQLESKVKNCHNTNTIFDTRNYVLLDDVRKTIAAINYTHCCTELRDEYLQPELDKYKNIKIERTKGKSDMQQLLTTPRYKSVLMLYIDC